MAGSGPTRGDASVVDQGSADQRFCGHPIRRIAVAGAAVHGEGGCFGVTVEAAESGSASRCVDSADPVKVDSVTEAAGVGDVAGRVVEGRIRSGPVGRVSVESVVAGFAAVDEITDRCVEARVAARSGCGLVGVAALARGQVELGLLAVGCCLLVTAVNGVRSRTRSVGVAVAGDGVGIGVIGCETARSRRDITNSRCRDVVAEGTAAALSFQVDAAVAGGIGRVGVVAALPVGRVGSGVGMTGRAIADDGNPVGIEIVHNRRIGDKAAIDDIIRSAVAVQAGVLVEPAGHAVIDRVGEIDFPVGDRHWVTAAVEMAGAVEAAGAVAALQIVSVADGGCATGPAQIGCKAFVICDHIGPACIMKAERGTGDMAVEAADRVAVTKEIETVTALATAQIGICIGSVQGYPVGNMNVAAHRGLRTAAAAAGYQKKAEQGEAIDHILHHVVTSFIHDSERRSPRPWDCRDSGSTRLDRPGRRCGGGSGNRPGAATCGRFPSGS